MDARNLAQSLDHFVVPVDDIAVAEEFYVRVFGGVITKRNGLNTRQRKRGAVPHTFIQIGGKRMGACICRAKSAHHPCRRADSRRTPLPPQRTDSTRL